MKAHSTTSSLAAAFLVLALALPVAAQEPMPQDRLRDIATQIDTLIGEMETKAADDARLAEEIRERKLNIQQADQNVSDMIARLQSLTDAMDDGSDLSTAIIDFKETTVALIGEADASGDEIIKGAIPRLEETLTNLDDSDKLRKNKVEEARALIRTLEDNKKRLAFFYKAGQLSAAADLIEGSVKAYAAIVDGAQSVADNLLTELTLP